MSKLGIGVIGCGGLGTRLAMHANTIDGARVLAGADPATEQRRRFAEEFGVPTYRHHRELLAREDIGAVMVVTPNNTHMPITLDALRAGKHVFCEKPMGLNVAQCDRMIAEAERAGLKLMVGQVLRLFPVFGKIKDIIGSGVIGEPFAIFTARTQQAGPLARGWRRSKRSTGGLLLEINAHELDYMRYLMGEVECVSAQVGRFLDTEIEYEDLAFVELKFRNGGIGVLYSGLVAGSGEYRGVVHCKRGTLTHGGFKGPISYTQFDGEPVVIAQEDIECEDPYRHELRSFVESILTGSPMVFDGRDGRAAVAIAQAAYLSAKRGRAVRLS